MIAYNPAWLDALLIKDTARNWHINGLLSNEQWQAVQDQHPSPFYTPNLFVRIGLAIFCQILLSSAFGLIFLIGSPDTQTGVAIFCIFCGALCILALEMVAIRSMRHFSSGIDDMLLYVGATAVIGGLLALLPDSSAALVYCCFAWPILVVCSIRYLDRLMTAVAFACSLAIILLSVNEIPSLALYLLPFAGMMFSAGVYYFVHKGLQRYDLRHWHKQFTILQLLSLCTFYASGNYWVVQQAGHDFFQLEQPPISWFFWAFTFTVPALYIVLGLRYKERLPLDVGLGCTALAVLSYRYYYEVMPLAWAGTICGAVLFATAYLSIRYLRKNKGAYTYEADADSSLLQQAQEQVLAQVISTQTVNAPAKNESFGGGQFGGGGAGGEF